MIFHTIRNLRRGDTEIGFCSLNFYFSDWQGLRWHTEAWSRALAGEREASSLAVLRRILLPRLPPGNGTQCFCCSQFAIGRSRLRRLPLEFYEQLLAFVTEDPGYNPWEHQERRHRAKNGRCQMLEPIWHVLFGEPRVCSKQRASCRAFVEGAGSKVADFVVDRRG